MPPTLARRLVTTYSRPGQLVLAAGAGASTLAESAAAAGRQPVLDQPDPPRVFPPLGTARAALIVITAPAVTTDPATYQRWARALHRPTTAAAPAGSDDSTPTWGGLLVAVVPPGYGQQALRIGQVITAATHAGLNYLQHIVALTAPLRDEHLHPVPTPTQLTRYTTARRAGMPVHLPVHLDVIVLATQAHGPTTPADSAANRQQRPAGTGSGEMVTDAA